ncbi:low molecular weight protein-tyrosine-phosphatase [Candidatus Venteria ishoeyi]|uniref:protein-tyrosine-phosphatase n=1 Tax=Candidatus Venteria ishoeyi TaxID=1899563 RepID=A0A1H6FCE4_9GAMM|nr:low molecular weight protein-tyrosine-phosphatase [Candidatus Venteria ishoeyi]MDM8545187.1 low molecular weight protein-tyrosine-phosphatase [Candidatus Venteria ishoeyi]SEH06714.1 Low molecular weight protein-tyrosine-phosphatase YfkJ [Candidatus Venteria ishoeyi]
MLKILFVCMGNICRSPTAQGAFAELVKQQGLNAKIQIDSAGTHAYHIGKAPDQRAQAAARNRKIDLSDQRARQVQASDFEQFDYILAMDKDNEDNLRHICPSEHQDKIHLFLAFAPEHKEQEVPDPYYGGTQGFEHVLDLVGAAAQGLLNNIEANYGFA